jgi:diguanylate cyclase (GGDEF)-like protein
MRTTFSLRRILSFRSENLKDFFDELDIEKVIPKLTHYIQNLNKCENVIWLTREQFEVFRSIDVSAGINLKVTAAEQIMYRHIKMQSIAKVEESEVCNIVKSIDVNGDKQVSFNFGNHQVGFLQPIKCEKTGQCLAYIIVLGVKKSHLASLMKKTARDVRYMAKHIRFSLQHWATERLTFQDDLTGLYNQKYMSLVLENEIHRSEREQKKFSVLFMDVDFFKSVNDSRGHLVGSNLLIEIAKVLRGNIRKSDYAFRYGGDEFVVILPMTSAPNAKIVAERLREIIEKTDFVIDGERVKLTLSIGLAAYPDHAKTYKDIVKMADEAMYCGKTKSRNIVFVAS